MSIVELYVALLPAAPVWKMHKDPFAVFGHAQAFGITLDESWFFFDPTRRRLDLNVVHKFDEVRSEIERVTVAARTILRVIPVSGPPLPPLCPMTCAAQVAHLAGVRAFTVGGLERRLRAIGATEVKHEDPRGKRRGEGSAQA